MTDKEIYKRYPDSNCYGVISDDVKRKTEELLWKTVEAVSDAEDDATYRRDGSKRRMRESSRFNPEIFERYKQKRTKFLSRKNKSSHSENSLDWSQDEFKTYSDSGKLKKKGKRVRKYEKDFEWSPYTPNSSLQTNRKLRSQIRKPLIESESSSSDEEDMLFNFYMNGDSDYVYSKSASQSVPSDVGDEKPSSLSSSTLSTDTNFKNSSRSFGAELPFEKSSQIQSNPDTSHQKSDSVSGDIVSGIIENMNQLQGNRLKKSFKNSSQTSKSFNNVKGKTALRGRKRFKMTSSGKKDNVDKEVASLLKSLVNTVSSNLKKIAKDGKKFSKVCKYCWTPFVTTKSTASLCVICCDLGRCKSDAVNKKASNVGKIKLIKENKLKKEKISKTMSKVLKKLPKNEMQRLKYVEKADKTNEKGYNHCKSFLTPKDKNNENTVSNLIDTNETTATINKPVKNTNELKRKNDSSTSQSKKSKTTTKINSASDITKGSNQNKNMVSLKKYNDGLFLMTFPDPDEELNLPGKPSQPQKNDGTSVRKLNHDNVMDIGRNSVIVPSNSKQLQSDNKQYDTYLFPPIPTVIVSNYNSNNNNLNLSQTYYQNEITHQHALKSSSTLRKKSHSVAKKDLSNTLLNVKDSVTVSSDVSNHNFSFSSSNLLPHNTSVTFTAVPFNNSSNLQSFSVLNSNISSNKVTIMPVINSIMSLPSHNTFQSNTVQAAISNSNFSSTNLSLTISNETSQATNSLILSTANVLGPSTLKDRNHSPVQKRIAKSNDKITRRSNINSSECSEMSEGEDTNNNKQNRNLLRESENSRAAEDKSKTNAITDCNLDQINNSEQLNSGSQNGIASVIDVLDAVSILAVIDLEKNPHVGLNTRIQSVKGTITKLTSENNKTPEINKKIADCQYNLQLLNMAKKYLSLYGSFTKVSDHLLRKAQINNLIKIKKEKFEETTQSSCMFSSSSHNSNPNFESELSNTTDLSNSNNTLMPSVQTNPNHIQKLQSQVAAMNNAQLTHYGILPNSGTVHHYATSQINSLPPGVAAPTPITPRNECLIGEPRETPSRGSGPRTPARPESAASQAEEQTLVQIKKEQFETASSETTNCAYSQNNVLPQVSSQSPTVQQLSSMNMSVANATINLPINNTNETNIHLQSRTVPPNRTVMYNSNPNYSDVLLNIAAKQVVNTSVNPQSQISQNGQVLLGQQMFIQNGPGLSPKQAVPSSNQYVINAPFSTSTTGGTVIVNNSQVGQNALLTNVSNQQFYTSNQVSQLYYNPQITCIPNNNVSTVATQNVSAAQVQVIMCSFSP